jgi:hypothetical protein
MRNRPLPPLKKALARPLRLAWAAALSRGAAERRRARNTGTVRAAALALARDGYACSCCGTLVVGRPHSARRRSRNGGDSPANLLTFLGDGSPRDPADHRARVDSGRDPMDAAREYRLSVGQDPALVPVMVSSQAGWLTLWLTAEGSYRTEPPTWSGVIAGPDI